MREMKPVYICPSTVSAVLCASGRRARRTLTRSTAEQLTRIGLTGARPRRQAFRFCQLGRKVPSCSIFPSIDQSNLITGDIRFSNDLPISLSNQCFYSLFQCVRHRAWAFRFVSLARRNKTVTTESTWLARDILPLGSHLLHMSSTALTDEDSGSWRSWDWTALPRLQRLLPNTPLHPSTAVLEQSCALQSRGRHLSSFVDSAQPASQLRLIPVLRWLPAVHLGNQNKEQCPF